MTLKAENSEVALSKIEVWVAEDPADNVQLRYSRNPNSAWLLQPLGTDVFDEVFLLPEYKAFSRLF